MARLLQQLWSDERGQDVAEYAVMLAVVLVIVVGTIRLIGGERQQRFFIGGQLRRAVIPTLQISIPVTRSESISAFLPEVCLSGQSDPTAHAVWNQVFFPAVADPRYFLQTVRADTGISAVDDLRTLDTFRRVTRVHHQL